MMWKNLADFTFLSTRTTASKYAAADINSVDTNVESIVDDMVYMYGDKTTLTADYTITDTDGYGRFAVDTSSRAVTVTLPTLADNLHRRIAVWNTKEGGSVCVTGEGAELIGLYENFYLPSQGNYLVIEAGATAWNILAHKSFIDTGWISRSDWTNVHLGSVQLTFPSVTGTFIVGEKITEKTSGYTAYVIAIAATYLHVKNVTGGYFTNGRKITGSTSGAYATLNAGTKNTDISNFHFLERTLGNLKTTLFISTDGTDANSYVAPCMAYGDLGYTLYYGDTWSTVLQSGANGLNILNTSGTTVTIDTEDYYYKIITECLL